VLRFTVASGTLTGKSATLTRYVPVASSASRSFSFYAEATFDNGTSSAQSEVQMSGEFYTADQTTTTGSPITSDNYGFNAFSLGPTGITAPDLYAVAPDLTTMTAPSDAAYLKLTITISTVATQSANRTVDLTEVRLNHGLPELLITDRDDPTTAPAFINAAAGELNVQSGSGDYLLLRPDTIITAATSISLNATTVTANGELVGAGVTTDLHHGITLQRTTNLTVNTSVDASATAITWSSAVKNTSLYAYWSSGSTIAIPLTGWYSINCHLISGTGLGTGFAFRLYALVNGVVIAETETQAGANTTSDTFSIATLAYLTAGNSLVFRASASSASKTIGGSRRSACSVVYLGNTSA
jgi:uncharacterized protein YfiM (DUF2279 family)